VGLLPCDGVCRVSFCRAWRVVQANIAAQRMLQSAHRVAAHTAILAFMMDAGLNRQRLEFAASALQQVVTRLKAAVGKESPAVVRSPRALTACLLLPHVADSRSRPTAPRLMTGAVVAVRRVMCSWSCSSPTPRLAWRRCWRRRRSTRYWRRTRQRRRRSVRRSSDSFARCVRCDLCAGPILLAAALRCDPKCARVTGMRHRSPCLARCVVLHCHVVHRCRRSWPESASTSRARTA
jgi:hypothetical protein